MKSEKVYTLVISYRLNPWSTPQDSYEVGTSAQLCEKYKGMLKSKGKRPRCARELVDVLNEVYGGGRYSFSLEEGDKTCAACR